jgi:hypothetical protein
MTSVGGPDGPGDGDFAQPVDNSGLSTGWQWALTNRGGGYRP